MDRIKIFFLATRPQFFPAVFLPVALGASAAWESAGSFNVLYFILTLAASLLYHAGMNVLNDYFDFLNGTDNINKTPLTPFTGGSRFIQRGDITPRETFILGFTLVSAGSAVGLYLAVKVSWVLIIIGGVGLFSGIFYSAPPLFFAGRGMGEFIVGLNFGVLTVLGSYLVQTGRISPEPVFASLPLSFLVSALLYINEFPDYEADRSAGKRNLVVRLGLKRARPGFCLLVAGAYLSIILGAVLGYLPALCLAALVSGVFALISVKGFLRNYDGGAKLIPSIKSIILAQIGTGALLIASNIL
ncbi:MAG: 1,4-dihydroxy-2-naphthoate octaprenyltransferase [Thermodesulfobacteriota bacterium]